jgi:hypothetical protein
MVSFVESRSLKNVKDGPRSRSSIVPDWPNPPPNLAETLSRFISQANLIGVKCDARDFFQSQYAQMNLTKECSDEYHGRPTAFISILPHVEEIDRSSVLLHLRRRCNFQRMSRLRASLLSQLSRLLIYEVMLSTFCAFLAVSDACISGAVAASRFSVCVVHHVSGIFGPSTKQSLGCSPSLFGPACIFDNPFNLLSSGGENRSMQHHQTNHISKSKIK